MDSHTTAKISDKNNLTLPNVTMVHAGDYVCTARLDDKRSVASVASLEVEEGKRYC